MVSSDRGVGLGVGLPADGLLTGTTDERLQKLDEIILLAVDAAMVEDDFSASEVYDGLLRRAHVLRTEMREIEAKAQKRWTSSRSILPDGSTRPKAVSTSPPKRSLLPYWLAFRSLLPW